jgi:hypothetical protein
VYARESSGRTFTLGVSGSLWKDALVMYDRETESLWTQITGEALRGPMDGARLRKIPSVTTTWRSWKEDHPETLVLVHDPKLSRSEHYVEYDGEPDTLGIFGTKNVDDRLEGKRRVLGVAPGALGNAVPVAYLMEKDRLINDSIGGTPVVVVTDAVGDSRIFGRSADGRELHFIAGDDGPGRATDRETGSSWDLMIGKAIAGPLAGTRLEAIPATQAFWFAWIAFYPGSEIRPPQDSSN